MNIAVLLKQTFDTEEKITLIDGKVSDAAVKFIMNPYDEFAVEEAIRLKERHGGEVTVVSIGPDRAESAMRTAMAMGADKGILMNDEALFGDEFILSKALAKALGDRGFDLVIGGYFAIDSGSGQVAIRLAEELDMAHVGSVTELSVEGDKATVRRDVEGDSEVIEAALPLLITAQQGLNEPRYPSLPGIMKARIKPLERLDAASIGWDGSLVSPTEAFETHLPPSRGAGKVLKGELAEQVNELLTLLRHDNVL